MQERRRSWGIPRIAKRGWFEKYGAMVTVIGVMLGIAASCWAFMVHEFTPIIDKRVEIKTEEKFAVQEKKTAEDRNEIKFVKEMLIQHLSVSERMRASREVFFQNHGYYPDQKE